MSQSPSQSAPTILIYQDQVGLIFFKGRELKNMEVQKTGSFLFNIQMYYNDPVFCTLLFGTHILDLFFRVINLPIFKTKIVGANWLGECLLFGTQDGHTLSGFCVPYILKNQKKAFRVQVHWLLSCDQVLSTEKI